MTIELANLANGEEIEEWYPLAGMTPIGEWGSLRLRIRYYNILIFMRCIKANKKYRMKFTEFIKQLLLFILCSGICRN